MAWFDNFVRKYISEGHSLMAWDIAADKMVGVVIFTQCKSELLTFAVVRKVLSERVKHAQKERKNDSPSLSINVTCHHWPIAPLTCSRR